MEKKINLIVNEKDQNTRVDSFISMYNKEISRSRIKNLILSQNLKINNQLIMDPSKKIFMNDKVSIQIPEPKKTSLKPFKYNLDIIYEDEDLIVINKSAGIAIHPGAGNYDNTIVNALINYDKKLSSNISDELRPGIVHRIDKNTSGLVVVAKNNLTHENLSSQFNKHSILRSYQLLIWGKLRPANGRIETYITRSSKNRQMMQVSQTKGKKAITNYKTLEVFENKKTPTLSLVECKLETGRTHQIRVHMNYLGNSIVGDDKYKKRLKKIHNIDEELHKLLMGLNRQFLHAKILGFFHPQKKKQMIFNSKLPKELVNILKKLAKIKKLNH